VITTDGRHGYWRDETYVDTETLIIAGLSKSGPTVREDPRVRGRL
jgi:hypothetical protein